MGASQVRRPFRFYGSLKRLRMNIGLPEIIVILVIVMLLFGPSQLPKLARGLGEAMKEFRKASSEMERGAEENPENTEKSEDKA